MAELADVFRLHGPAYLDKYGKNILPSHRRVMWDVLACRTEVMDGHVYRCPQCLQDRYVYHSCKNRHCPKCQNDQADLWLAKQQRLLLPVTYFMVTFTLPAEFRSVVRSHQKDLYNLMFRASSAALQKLAQDPRHIGGALGMLGVLQTWKRDLGYHPHIHYIIPGGGLRADGLWRSSKNDYLVPEKALTIIYRAKIRDGLKALKLYDRIPEAIWKTNWCVDIEPVASGQEALKYLTPYIFRVAISNRNILAVDTKTVTFRYRDAKTGQYVPLTLPAGQFIGRFLQHVLPKGFQKVRTYGLYHPKQRRELKLVKEQLRPKDCKTTVEALPTSTPVKAPPVRFICPCCHVDMIRIGKVINKRGPPLSW